MTTATEAPRWARKRHQVGDRVMVSARPAWDGVNRAPTMRDRTSLWGFSDNEWRAATISAVMFPDDEIERMRYSVQFYDGDAHWSFSQHEILPMGTKLPAVF